MFNSGNHPHDAPETTAAHRWIHCPHSEQPKSLCSKGLRTIKDHTEAGKRTSNDVWFRISSVRHKANGDKHPRRKRRGQSVDSFLTACYRTTEVVVARVVYERCLSDEGLPLPRASRPLLAKSAFGRDSNLLFLQARVPTKAMSRRLRLRLLMPHAIEI